MIVELALSGKPVREICSEYSLGETIVRKWIKDKAPVSIEGETLSLEGISKNKRKNIKIICSWTIKS